MKRLWRRESWLSVGRLQVGFTSAPGQGGILAQREFDRRFSPHYVSSCHLGLGRGAVPVEVGAKLSHSNTRDKFMLELQQEESKYCWEDAAAVCEVCTSQWSSVRVGFCGEAVAGCCRSACAAPSLQLMLPPASEGRADPPKLTHVLRLSFPAGLGCLRSDDSALHRYPTAPLVLQQAEVWFAKGQEELRGCGLQASRGQDRGALAA